MAIFLSLRSFFHFPIHLQTFRTEEGKWTTEFLKIYALWLGVIANTSLTEKAVGENILCSMESFNVTEVP